MARRHKKGSFGKRRSLKSVLSEFSEDVQRAVVDTLNASVAELKDDALKNMDKQEIKEDTGNLRESLEIKKATMKTLDATLKSEVYAELPKHPGMAYPAEGVPYGRLIEFSPRIGKPFFYTAFYEKKKKIAEEVFAKMCEAGKKSLN